MDEKKSLIKMFKIWDLFFDKNVLDQISNNLELPEYVSIYINWLINTLGKETTFRIRSPKGWKFQKGLSAIVITWWYPKKWTLYYWKWHK